MAVFHQIDFPALPARVRALLRKSVADDNYLVYGQTRSNLSVYALHGMGALLCLFVLYLSATADFADPLQDRLWTIKGTLIWYAFWIFGIVYTLDAIRLRRTLLERFRFLPGHYVFPFALVDARLMKLVIYDLTRLRKLDVVHHTTNGAYTRTMCNFILQDGSHVVLTIKNQHQAEIMLERFNRFQAAGRAAFDQRDARALYGFDPFLDLRKNQWRGTDKYEESAFKRAAATLLVALHPWLMGIAIVLAAIFWVGRNALADYQMHKNAQQLKTEAAYLGYIGHGRFYTQAMRAALPRVVFDEVKQKQSVSLLRALKPRFPGADIQADIAKEIHALYQKSWKKFEAQAVSTDTRLVASMEQLLRYAEEHDDPQVSIQFTRPTPNELNQLDGFLKSREVASSGLHIALAAQHFGDDSASRREARIIAGLRSAFGSIFPNDVLAFVVAKVNQRERPMLDIAYQIEPSGSVYFSEKKKEDGFVGLVIRFRAEMIVPTVDERWKFELEVEPPQRFQVEYKASGTAGVHRPSDGQVYAVMAERAFDQLASKITAAFFRPDSAVIMRQMKRVR